MAPYGCWALDPVESCRGCQLCHAASCAASSYLFHNNASPILQDLHLVELTYSTATGLYGTGHQREASEYLYFVQLIFGFPEFEPISTVEKFLLLTQYEAVLVVPNTQFPNLSHN